MAKSYLSFAQGNGTEYSLHCINDSTVNWTFYIYQKMPQQPSDIFSLAWFVSPYKIAPGNEIIFKWNIDYSFVWGQSGELMEGVQFNASGHKPCSITGANQTTFSMDNNAPQLSTPTTGGEPSYLTVDVADNVPNNSFSTGIGMSGQGTFVQQALQNAPQTYQPEPLYYVAAATQMQMGCVLASTVTHAWEFEFESNIYAKTATLGKNNKWVIS